MNRSVILIAEADDTLRRSLEKVLVRRGFGVIDSSDKPGILRTFPNPTIDLIILGSLEDSTWDGLEVAQQIRRLDRKVPIILIAAKPS